MRLIEAATLGAVQGLAEFLPISSSGHLVLVQHLFGLGGARNIPFDVLLHVATLLAVVWCLREDIGGLARRFLSGGRETRLALRLVAAMVPTVVVVLLIKRYILAAFESPAAVGVALLVTGIVLFVAPRIRTPSLTMDTIGWRQALSIGVAQGFAAMPGLSRSGLTICAGMAGGIDAVSAARFSFLLAIPAILGATALNARDLVAAEGIGLRNAVVGMAVAWATGVASIRWLMRIARAGRFDGFAYYCWAIGGITLAVAVFGGPLEH